MGDITPFKLAGAERTRHFVRVTRADHQGFVEFQYSIDDPTLYLEMTLPPAAFAEFCTRHAATHLSAGQAAAVDSAARRWQLGREHEDESHVD